MKPARDTLDTQVHYRTCCLCEATCGIEIRHRGNEILSIRGDKEDVASNGHICPKGLALEDLHDDPDRLRQPLRKTETGWERISWEEAFDEVADNIKRIQKEHGRDAVSFYLGNPAAHNLGIMLFLPLLALSLRTRYRYSASSLDQQPQMMAGLQMFGNQALIPVADLDRTDYFLCIGANPVVSNGSLMVAPDVKKRLERLAQRGKLVVVDPRFSETAGISSEHHFIKPGTDPLFLLAMVHTLYAEGLVDPGRHKSFIEGLEELGEAVRPFTPESVAQRTGIEAETIKRIAREFAAAPSAVAHGRMGICTQVYATLTCWLVDVLAVITGNLDREGGAMFTRPAIDIPGLAALVRQQGSFGKARTRVRGLPEFGEEFPAAAMAEEILSEGPGRTRALLTITGNVVLSCPNGRRLDLALEELDFMAAIDFYLNETTRHAAIILPPTGLLEQSHYDVALNMFTVRNSAKHSPPLFEKDENERYPWEIILELITRLDSRGPVSGLLSRMRYGILKRLGADGMLDLALRFGPYGKRIRLFEAMDSMLRRVQVFEWYDRTRGAIGGLLKKSDLLNLLVGIGPYCRHASNVHGLSLARLKEHPHGIDLGPMEPCLPGRLFTRDKTIKLVPGLYLKEIERLLRDMASEDDEAAEYQFKLINRRDVRTNNSWMHNCKKLMKGKNRCTAMIHPEDAKTLDIEDGRMVRVSSRVGSIELPAEISGDIMPGVVCIPHGWGHDRPGIRMRTAQENPGVSVNDITDDQLIDTCAGVAVFNGVPVNISRVG